MFYCAHSHTCACVKHLNFNYTNTIEQRKLAEPSKIKKFFNCYTYTMAKNTVYIRHLTYISNFNAQPLRQAPTFFLIFTICWCIYTEQRRWSKKFSLLFAFAVELCTTFCVLYLFVLLHKVMLHLYHLLK